jgi:hypothetical protein
MTLAQRDADGVLIGDADAGAAAASADANPGKMAMHHRAGNQRTAVRERRDAAGRRSLTGLEVRRQRSIQS